MQRSAVRRSCHTIALASGLPVALSHTTVVSRRLVMPMAATALALALGEGRAAGFDHGADDLLGVVLDQPWRR